MVSKLKEVELYELILLIKFTSTEEEIKEKIERYRNFLTEKGSRVMVKDHGKRSLAYPISGFTTASYIQFIYLGNGDLVKLLNTEIGRDEFILRAITTKLQDESVSEMFATAI